MAIVITAGAWASGSTSVTPALPATPQAGDVHILFVGSKPFSDTIGTPNGWTPITGTDGTNGSVANGTDVGSVNRAAFYRVWQSGDANPTVSITSGNVTLAVIHRLRPTSGSVIDTPVGVAGNDTSSGTGYSATMASNPGITAADVLVAGTVIAGNNSTFGSPTMSATGLTIGTVTENPATEGTTGTGLDLEASSSTATVTSGTASAAAVIGWTLSVAQTGSTILVRIREHVPAPQTFPISFSETGQRSETLTTKATHHLAFADTWQRSESLSNRLVMKLSFSEIWQPSESLGTATRIFRVLQDAWQATESLVAQFIDGSASLLAAGAGLLRRVFGKQE